MNLTLDELLDYASLHAATPLEKALTRAALELSDEVEYLTEQLKDD
jgi:hypothetical protein